MYIANKDDSTSYESTLELLKSVLNRKLTHINP